MGNGFQFIDIILFGMIAAFLILRLRNVLGRRDGHEGGYPDPFKRDEEAGPEDSNDNVVPLPHRDGTDSAFDAEPDGYLGDTAVSDGESALGAGFIQIHRADRSFNEEDFVVGARVAFEMVLNAYSSGDTDTLRPLLSDDVFANFATVIKDRERAGHVMEDTLVGITASEIVEAYMEGKIANVTVKFVTEQINVMRDENGDVIEGDPNAVVSVTDFWTFSRDTQSRDPNWALVATRSLD